MIKFLESQKIELFLFVSFIVSIALSILDSPFRLIPLEIIFRIYFLLYLVRIFISFRQWKISKGVSLINACLNFQIAFALMAIGFTFLSAPAYPITTYDAITASPHFLLIIGVFLLLLRPKKTKWAIYWAYLKVNILKAALGIVFCLILFYSFDMSSKLNPYPPHDRWIILPK